jgi:alkanesulfonate monooxygenase SsuD/methylene tetrahydromethanopterin reductase-like flavin-dependent oxidoreductase (luciferase family)
VFRRVARTADGWIFGGGAPNPFVRAKARTPRDLVETLRRAVQTAGRDPATVGIEARVSLSTGTPDDWRRAVEEWRRLGATHLSVATMRAGITAPGGHVERVRQFMEAVQG